uniref:Rho GTPase activating protein 31 n=1 Tax=Oryzias melastigma TaxID=30732 RepID=A0A3B3CSQ3_ORYME
MTIYYLKSQISIIHCGSFGTSSPTTAATCCFRRMLSKKLRVVCVCRQEFCSEAGPDLTKEMYLQDIHCVGSLCKLYFRELPNPLLTYELYSRFTEAISVQGDHEKLSHIQGVIKELPAPHFRTLEYLTKHLAYLATLSTQTNMHTRNLALVWAPNLLRSKDIEASSGNGDMAFQEVRKQQSVIEFILNHTEQIFSGASAPIKPKEGQSLMCGEKYATLPISGQGGPMKLMSLEEAQARSLSPNHPLHKERQRENSLPDTSSATLYHTVIDISDKRKFSGKSKKWKSIFNLGRSVESKGKLSRNGSVFIRAQGITQKAALRPSRSMESLCSLPPEDERAGSHIPAAGSTLIPDVKSRTLGSDSLLDLSERDQNWELKGKKAGGWSVKPKDLPGASAPPQKPLPEQLKVFKGDDLSGFKPTSPKNRRMLYSGSSHNSSSRPSFPGSFFPLESSPRHQRRAVNISEPFAVSVPLRVSAVISSNSTPCRGLKDKAAAALKPSKEPPEQRGLRGKSNTFPKLEPKKQDGADKKITQVLTSRKLPQDSNDILQERQGGREVFELDALAMRECRKIVPPSGINFHKQPTDLKQDERSSTGKNLWSDLHQELKITEPEIDLLDETFKPVFSAVSTSGNNNLLRDVKSKRSRSSPSLSLLCAEQSSNSSLGDGVKAPRSDGKRKQPSESDLLFCVHRNGAGNAQNVRPADATCESEGAGEPRTSSLQIPASSKETRLSHVLKPLILKDFPQVTSFPARKCLKHEVPQEKTEKSNSEAKINDIHVTEKGQRLSVYSQETPNILELPNLDDEEGFGRNLEELDLVESWEDLSSTKQWVTSPLHSPDVEELFDKLSPFRSNAETPNSDVGKVSPPSVDKFNQTSQNSSSNSESKLTHWPSAPMELSRCNTKQPIKSSTTKPKNTVSSQRFTRQTSCDAALTEKREDSRQSKHRPCSLNLDLGYRCIRDISNQQNRDSEFSSSHRGLPSFVNKGHSELDLFLNDRQAPLRRNSAPVSVSSVRTAFMIKTCQARAVPVVPPKVQYTQTPQTRQDNHLNPVKKQEKECPKTSAETGNAAPIMSDLKEELENKEPKHPNLDKPVESGKTTSTPELPVITRRHNPNLEVFVDCPRPTRGSVLQRPSFRNRQRPQSLILLSPPFPIMDYPTSGDDGKLLSSIKSLNDTSAVNVFSKDIAENIRTSEGLSLQNKMTIPKSGQRLETSTSCFYQPQRRSMIFDSRSHRQIE